LGIFYTNLVFLLITFEPEMLESQSKAQKTQMANCGVEKYQENMGLAGKSTWQKRC